MLSQNHAVYRGNVYRMESVMHKTDNVSLVKNENGKEIILEVPKTEIEKAWVDMSLPWYGELKCDNADEINSKYFITKSVLCAGSGSGKALSESLEKYGFIRVIYNAETDTAVYIRVTERSDPLLHFESLQREINVMHFI